MSTIDPHLQQILDNARDRAQPDVVDELRPDETPEQRVARLRREAQLEVLHAATPTRFKQASLADLDPKTQQRDAVAEWLAGDRPTLVLVGGVGTGKSHAAWATIRAAAAAGSRCYGTTLVSLFKTLRPGAAASPAPRLAYDADLFLFDDVGAERPTDWSLEQLTDIADTRTAECRRQILTTNADAAQLREHLGERAFSRLMGGAVVVQFSGEDQRRRRW